VTTEKPGGFDDWWDDMRACADNGEAALREAWERSAKEYRKHLLDTNRDGWDRLKEHATRANRVLESEL
jgi:hypothetical protein